MNESPFEECTEQWDRENGGQRFVRSIDKDCWISVLHRMTGFGYMEWETALCFNHEVVGRPRTWQDRDTLIIAGDRREELATMPKEQLRQWYADNIDGNRNSMETLLETLKAQAVAAGEFKSEEKP